MSCPKIYPFAVQTLRWPFEDPAAATGGDDERLVKFRAVRDSIEWRVRAWLKEIGSESTSSAATCTNGLMRGAKPHAPCLADFATSPTWRLLPRSPSVRLADRPPR